MRYLGEPKSAGDPGFVEKLVSQIIRNVQVRR